MACSKISIIFGLFQILIAAVWAKVEMTVDATATQLYEGDEVTISCDLLYPKEQRMHINWIKGEDSLEIATNDRILAQYDDGHYKAEAQVLDEVDGRTHVLYTLTISPVQSGDNGKIGCRNNLENLNVFKTLTVFVGIQDFGMTMSFPNGSKATGYRDGQEVELIEGQVYKLSCHAFGANPEPHVMVKIGDEDISSNFEKQSSQLIMATPDSSQGWNVKLVNDAWQVTYKHANKQLQCFAEVPFSNFEQKKMAVNISLTGYKPQFDCARQMTFKMSEEDIEFRCKVHANPPIDESSLKFRWFTKAGEKQETTPGGKFGFYRGELIDGDNEHSKVMILHTNRMTTQKFRNYTFEASNSLGTNTHVIQVVEDESDKKDESGSAAIPIATLTFTSVFLVTLLH